METCRMASQAGATCTSSNSFCIRNNVCCASSKSAAGRFQESCKTLLPSEQIGQACNSTFSRPWWPIKIQSRPSPFSERLCFRALRASNQLMLVYNSVFAEIPEKQEIMKCIRRPEHFYPWDFCRTATIQGKTTRAKSSKPEHGN